LQRHRGLIEALEVVPIPKFFDVNPGGCARPCRSVPGAEVECTNDTAC
jgi:hypothetical protein